MINRETCNLPIWIPGFAQRTINRLYLHKEGIAFSRNLPVDIASQSVHANVTLLGHLVLRNRKW